MKETNFSVLMVNHDVVRLHISVHDALAVAKIESLFTISNYAKSRQIFSYLQELKDIIPNIVVDEFWVEGSKVGVINVFEDKGWCFALHQE